ncbi:MAG: ATP synthase F1 subunit gamma [Candidatus Obscuribacterales bacterium]|jgi:F-type H+-transporting ATPase subunit gamma|nr:ATP synthase F1 subunit gamma [Candidatus Obscuribacterales bacterium]
MANLKAIRRRIKSVQSTQKITRAMKMVAAAKVRRAQARALSARPYTQRIISMLREIVREVADIDLNEIPLLRKREVKTIGLLIITSDRGLCGSYNSSILRASVERIRELEKEGKKVKLILVGLKAATFFRSIKVDKLMNPFTLLPAVPSVQEAKLIAEKTADAFMNGDIDAVEIISTHFINMLRSQVTFTKFLPVEMPPPSADDGLSPITLFEPSIPAVLELELVPKYVENVVFQCLLDASASELAARMNAMSNASTNAQELIQGLTLIYNRARQASITQELLEVVAGAEALRG